jgi:DNA-binding MarR family transcriptional regulator
MKSKKELIEELNQSFQRAGTLNVIHTNAVANKVGLSATEFEAMDIIKNNQPITAGHLAKYCGVTTGAITGIVDRLERAGFVRRVNCPSDRRKVFLEPIVDREVSKRIFELYRPMSEAFEKCIADLTKEEVEFLIKAQTKLSAVTEKVITELRNK